MEVEEVGDMVEDADAEVVVAMEATVEEMTDIVAVAVDTTTETMEVTKRISDFLDHKRAIAEPNQ